MKKLLLKVEDLAVDSFETTVPRGRTLVTCPETSNCPSQRPTCGIQPAPNDADAAGPPDLGTDYTPCFVCCM